jgi:homoserine kinase type II
LLGETFKEKSNILPLPQLLSSQTFKTFLSLRQLSEMVRDVLSTLEGAFLREQITEIIETLYSVGTVIDVFEIFGGTTNRSFGVVVQNHDRKQALFVRKYKQGITGEEIQFEHALINHAIQNGLSSGAGPVMDRDGRSFVKPANSANMFAVYEYLPGEDKYAWDNPYLTDTEFINAGRLLAEFHNAVHDFNPGGLKRREPPMVTLWGEFPEQFKQFARQRRPGKMLPYLRTHLDAILGAIARHPLDIAESEEMPVIATHYDYHPGNLKWDQERIVGFFDFDWSKVDFRLIDVCMALVYFCCHWEDLKDGRMRLDKVALFLKHYQQRLKALAGLTPLTDSEIEMMPRMVLAGDIYLLHWVAATYHSMEKANSYEYLAYLKHCVRLMYWLETHQSELRDTIADALK